MNDKPDKHNQAIKVLSLLTIFLPDNPEIYLVRSVAYAAKGGFDEALSDFGRAIELDRKHSAAYNGRGAVR